MRAMYGFALLFLFATPAIAEPMTAADKAKIEGVWRRNDNTQSDDQCGTDGNFQYGVEITIEFKMTGGEVDFEDQAEGSGPDKITSATKKGDTYYLALADRSPPWDIKLIGKDKAQFYGQNFARCAAAEPRDGIKLSKDDFAYLSTGFVSPEDGPSYGTYFVNSRVPGGCKAEPFQALAFDLRSPTDPSLLRFESYALKEKLKAKKKPGFAMDTDGMGRWPITAILKTPTGWTFKMIELIPPNGSRGDAMDVDVVRTKTGISIPAWKRDYIRCKFAD